MRYVSAYLLARLGGNDSPSASDIESILGSVGIDVDSERLSKVISELEGKDVDEVIKGGLSKLASVPSGGAVSSGAGASAGGGAAPEAEKEEKPAEKEEEEESDDDMGFGLFD